MCMDICLDMPNTCLGTYGHAWARVCTCEWTYAQTCMCVDMRFRLQGFWNAIFAYQLANTHKNDDDIHHNLPAQAA